ncbi:MAG: hypothetical protein L3J11_05185 [Draconibacterium sp.]|nr:hypothetical protein [Draconibacterium sp.]
MVLDQATETLINYSINPFKSFTGERTVLKKDILPIVHKMKNSRFGVETLINLYYQAEGKKVKYVMLSGLKHPTKFDKTSTPQAMKEFYNGRPPNCINRVQKFQFNNKNNSKTTL